MKENDPLRYADLLNEMFTCYVQYFEKKKMLNEQLENLEKEYDAFRFQEFFHNAYIIFGQL